MAEQKFPRDTIGKTLEQRAMADHRADLVHSAARVEFELASRQFDCRRDRRSFQRLVSATRFVRRGA
jgi:hypothetical protein